MRTYDFNAISKKVKKYLFKLPFHIFYFPSYLFPRSEKIWVFGCWDGTRFADNSKYFFLYVANNEKDKVRAIWISKRKSIVLELKKRGYEAYKIYSLKGLYYSLRAKYMFFDLHLFALNYWISGGAATINFWHGLPLKKIEFDVEKGRHSRIPHAKGFRKIIYKYLLISGFIVSGQISSLLFDTILLYSISVLLFHSNNI